MSGPLRTLTTRFQHTLNAAAAAPAAAAAAAAVAAFVSCLLLQITFREIIAHYKRQAHAKQEVFRTVVLQQTDPHLLTQSTGDIIAFYNAVSPPTAVTHRCTCGC
jgi:hypothetical protein